MQSKKKTIFRDNNPLDRPKGGGRGSSQITCNYHTIIPDTVACTILICFLWLSEVDRPLGYAQLVHFSLSLSLFLPLALSLWELELIPDIWTMSLEPIQHIYIYTHTCTPAYTHIYMLLLKFFLTLLQHSRPILLPFSISLSPPLSVLVHLQNSHYTLYRGVNSTQNPNSPCHVCPREKQQWTKSQAKGKVRSDTKPSDASV